MGITKKEAEKHLERLARRRARYAERKKLDALHEQQHRPVQEVAPTPHAHDVAINETVAQLALPFENRLARLVVPEPTARQQAEIDYENERTVGEWRTYINQIFKGEGR